jgi:hypothetical protein
MEGTPISNAREWLAENPSESIIAASRIFKVPESTLRMSLKRRAQNLPPKGGRNLEQYHLGLFPMCKNQLLKRGLSSVFFHRYYTFFSTIE